MYVRNWKKKNLKHSAEFVASNFRTKTLRIILKVSLCRAIMTI